MLADKMLFSKIYGMFFKCVLTLFHELIPSRKNYSCICLIYILFGWKRVDLLQENKTSAAVFVESGLNSNFY